MKTMQDLYKEIINSDEQRKAFMEAAKSDKALEFIKAHGCEATEEELKAFLSKQSGELSDEELDNAAGGGCNGATAVETAVSIFTVGFACACQAIDSATTGYVGQQTGDRHEGRLCN